MPTRASRVAVFLLTTLAAIGVRRAEATDRPNVIIIITDDQGYGDLSLHGNPHLETPNIDRIGKEGARLTQFHVSPVCAPTRASLMTGRYNYRTRVVDTYLGRALMDPEEVTIAEILGEAGYRTGIFGKWHLGDNYPLRAIDQGFQEALVCTGGGITQPSDPEGNHYQDPRLLKNGVWTKYRGYCTDIFMDGAIEFIKSNKDRPFFCYVPTNAPHDPLEIAESYVAPFRAKGLDERTSKILGMVKNIDDNVGRLLKTLADLALDEKTIVVFLTDNGPSSPRYNAGMRNRKGSVYEGGIRVPGFVRWVGEIKPREVDRLAAHIDLAPTLLDACGARPPQAVKFDGKSLLPLLRGEPIDWPDRTLFFQWHRGDEPVAFQAAAVRTQRHKLVNGRELYDIEADPAESLDIAKDHPELVAELRKRYEAWFRDVSSTRGYAPPRIVVGSTKEDPVTLTRQDWRGPRAGWGPGVLGYWEIAADRSGLYDVTLLISTAPPAPNKTEARLRVGGADLKAEVAPGATSHTFPRVFLSAGPTRLEAWTETLGKSDGVKYVRLSREAGK